MSRSFLRFRSAISARPATASRCSSISAIGALRVAAIQRVDDGAMLAHRAFRGVRPAVEREDQAGAGRYFSHVARQHRDCPSCLPAGCEIRSRA